MGERYGCTGRLKSPSKEQIEAAKLAYWERYGFELSAVGAQHIVVAVLSAGFDEICKHLDRLVTLQKEYRAAYERHGGDSITTGRALDRMRRAGDEARVSLEKSGWIEAVTND